MIQGVPLVSLIYILIGKSKIQSFAFLIINFTSDLSKITPIDAKMN